jgi:hypothetical protein
MKYYNLALAHKLMKNYGHVLSDEDVKTINESVDPQELAQLIVEKGGPYNQRMVEHLVKNAGDMNSDQQFERDGHRWRDDVLANYAKFIQNYKYKYNEEALKLDPSTDLDKEHIGPMAQDIEKVNPAAVNNDPETGYKTVDTGRLALMNAGAIAELARQIQGMQNG